MEFKDGKSFLKKFLVNPKALTTAALITIGGVGTVTGQQLMKITGITPTIDAAGQSIHSKTYALNLNDAEKKFIFNSFEYRYGKDFNIKNFAKGTYNVGLEVGSNNLMFNNKLVTDKLYEQVNLALKLSKILDKNISFRIGFDKRLNNYVLKDFNFGEATKGFGLHSSVNTSKTGTGVSLVFKNGKLVSYDGIQEVKFSKNFTGALRIKNLASNNLKNAYYELHGVVNMSKKDKFVFLPHIGVGADKSKLKAFNPNYEFGVFFKPIKKGNKFSAYAEVGFNKEGRWVGFTRLNYQLTNGKSKTPKVKPRARSNLFRRKPR